MLTTIGAYYGSLLVYAIMGGIFLAQFHQFVQWANCFLSDHFIFATGGLDGPI